MKKTFGSRYDDIFYIHNHPTDTKFTFFKNELNNLKKNEQTDGQGRGVVHFDDFMQFEVYNNSATVRQGFCFTLEGRMEQNELYIPMSPEAPSERVIIRFRLRAYGILKLATVNGETVYHVHFLPSHLICISREQDNVICEADMLPHDFSNFVHFQLAIEVKTNQLKFSIMDSMGMKISLRIFDPNGVPNDLKDLYFYPLWDEMEVKDLQVL